MQTLAILGREFVLSLARAVAGKSEDELERLIARLQLGEFVYEQPSIIDVEYIFKHALTQEVAYNSVLLERRKRLHEHVGHAIETIYTASLDDHVPELAHHFSRSGNQVKAVEYQHLAGTQAMARGALPQAIRDFEQTLALLKGFPSGDERDALELQTLSPLGTAYIAVRGYAAPEVGPVFVHARELAIRFFSCSWFRLLVLLLARAHVRRRGQPRGLRSPRGDIGRAERTESLQFQRIAFSAARKALEQC